MLRKHVGRIPILSRLPVKRQIYLVFCVAIVFPVMLLGSFAIRQIVAVLYDRAYQQVESYNTQARSVLFDATLNFYNVSTALLEDAQLRSLLQAEYASREEAASAGEEYTRLASTMGNQASIASIQVYTENDRFPTEGYIQSVNSQQVEDWFEKVRVPGSVYWESCLSQQDGADSPELTLVRSFPFTESQYSAILVIRMSNNYLKNRIQNGSIFISISLNQEPIFFSTQRSLQGTLETAAIDYSQGYFQSGGMTECRGKRGVSYISTFVPYMGEDALLYFNSVDFDAPGYIRSFLLLSGAIFLIAVFLPCVIILVYTSWFTHRVNQLKDAMHAAAQGEFDPIQPFKGDDELSVIFVDLQNVIANVLEQQAEIYRGQLKEQELINQQQKMKFKLLASQINPHFIYNTLETIRMMALCNGDKDVAGATALFGKTMRYVLENTGTSQTTLDKELDYVENYLAIQKLRFEDKVNYSIELPPEFEPSRFRILPLLLQPIVENSISHGIKESSRQGWIRIRIWTEEPHRLLVRVSDNGLGIPAEKMEELRAHIAGREEEPVTSSIGMYNIYQRIQLFYGNEYGMELESQEGEGTCVTLTLPILPA